MVQLARWVVAGQIIIGNKGLPSVDMYSIVVIIVHVEIPEYIFLKVKGFQTLHPCSIATGLSSCGCEIPIYAVRAETGEKN